MRRAILSPRNETSDNINNYLFDKLHGDKKTYCSFDSVAIQEEAVNYPTKILNSLNPPGIFHHKFSLTMGTPIILLRKLSLPNLCNGTGLRVSALQPNIIEASTTTGCAKGVTVFIPRIPMIPTDNPFEFNKR